MTLLAWAGGLLRGQSSQVNLWAAVLLSGFGFALYHLAGVSQLGFSPSSALIRGTMLVNLLGGVIYGSGLLLFGLSSAIVAHALTHLVWGLVDGRLFERFAAKNQTV